VKLALLENGEAHIFKLSKDEKKQPKWELLIKLMDDKVVHMSMTLLTRLMVLESGKLMQ